VHPGWQTGGPPPSVIDATGPAVSDQYRIHAAERRFRTVGCWGYQAGGCAQIIQSGERQQRAGLCGLAAGDRDRSCESAELPGLHQLAEQAGLALFENPQRPVRLIEDLHGQREGGHARVTGHDQLKTHLPPGPGKSYGRGCRT